VTGDVLVVDDVATAFADLVVREQPRTIALSGGGTAKRCYELLATRSGIDWSAVEVLFGDERVVPVGHPDSNEGMARAVLLDHAGPRAIHSMAGAGDTADTAALAYDALIAAAPPIDVVHLGLGPDGHTASLFPGSAALQRSRLVVFTVSGGEKRDAFARIRAGDDLPAGRVDAERVLWLVDPAAAG
jgi:6-phosphogluconolactonase